MIKFENNLNQVSDWLNKAAETSVTETTAEVVEEIKQFVPKKTGALANSYTFEQTGVASVEIGSPLPYALGVELGTRHTSAHPALIPAIVKAENKLKSKIREKLK